MTISRRSFARSILAAVAGATVLRQAVAAPVKEQIAEAFGVPEGIVEFCRQYLPQQKIEPWQEDVLVRIEAAKLSANVKVPACLIEDSMVDFQGQMAAEFGRDLAERVDRECWEAVGDEWGRTIDLKSLKAAMDSAPKPSYGFITINDARSLEGLSPLPDDGTARLFGYPVHVTPGLEGCWRLSRSPTTLPDGWKMTQCGPYPAGDWCPTRRRFDFTLDPHSQPR